VGPHYIGQVVWYEGDKGVAPGIIVQLYGPPDTHRVDLHMFGPDFQPHMKRVPFGTEKGTWRFPEVPKP